MTESRRPRGRRRASPDAVESGAAAVAEPTPPGPEADAPGPEPDAPAPETSPATEPATTPVPQQAERPGTGDQPGDQPGDLVIALSPRQILGGFALLAGLIVMVRRRARRKD